MDFDDSSLNTHRVDLYLSCHAESLLLNKKSIDDFVTAFRVALLKHAESERAKPCVFIPCCDLQGVWLEQRTRTLMQIRGGGIALCLFTKDYFRDKYSIAELRCLMNLFTSDNFSILFYSLDRPREQLFKDLRQLPFLHNLDFYNLSTLIVKDIPSDVNRLVQDIWKIWDGSNSVGSRYGIRKYALGKTRKETFSCLRNAYTNNDIPFLCDTFEVQAGLFSLSLPTVFNEGLEKHFVTYKNLSCLTSVANQVPHARAERQRAAIQGFEAKWVKTDELDWSREEQNSLMRLFKESTPSSTSSTSAFSDDNRAFSRRYRATFYEDFDRGTVILDYYNVNTFESQLKSELLSEDIQSFPIIVVCGMVGVGKSVALRGLGSLQDVKRKFNDGVIYIYLGRNSSLLDLNRKLEDVVSKCGGVDEADQIRKNENFEFTSSVVHKWFQGKNCLFLIDDVWFVNDITVEQIIRLSAVCENGNSRIGITTRDTRFLVLDRGNNFKFVIFRPRETYGRIASKILLREASESRAPLDIDEYEAYERILRICNGLPLMLSSAGKTIQNLKSRLDSVKDIWRVSARELSLKCYKNGTHFFFEYLENTSEPWDSTNTTLELIEKDLNIRGCKSRFASFCVMQQEHSIPVFLLKKLWESEHQIEILKTSFDRVFLLEDIPSVSANDEKLRLHEITLIVARNLLENSSQQMEISRNLIGIYLLKIPSIYSRKRRVPRMFYTLRFSLVSHVPESLQSVIVRGLGSFDKKFLKIEDDGYIFKHVCHLLRGATWTESLMDLLSNPKWIIKQLTRSGLEQGKADINQAQDEIKTNPNALREETRIDASHFLSALSEACKFSLQYWDGDENMLWSQLYGRMLWMKNNYFAKRFLSSFSLYAPRPWVVPSEGCFPAAGSALRQIVHFNGEFLSAQLAQNCLYVCYRDGDDDLIVKVKRSQCNNLNEEVFPVSCSQSAEDIRFAEFSETCNNLRVEYCNGHAEDHAISSSGILRRDPVREAPYEPNLFLQQISSILNGLRFNIIDLYNDDTFRILFDDRQEVILLHRCEGRVINLLWKISNNWKMKTLHDSQLVSKYVCMSKNGKTVAYVVDGNELFAWKNVNQIWNQVFLEENDTNSTDHHYGNICSLFVSENGDCIGTGSTDYTVQLWKMKLKLCRISVFRGHWKPVTYVSLPQNGKYVVSASSDCTVRRWSSSEVVTEPDIYRGHRCAVSCAFVHHNSKLALSGGEDGSLCFWKRSKEGWVFESIGKLDGRVSCLNMSANGQNLISGGLDRILRLWPVWFWKKKDRCWSKFCLQKHNAPVTSVCSNTDGTVVVSGSEDKTIKICAWNGQSWPESVLWRFSEDQHITGVSITQSKDGHRTSAVKVSLQNGSNLNSLTIPLSINDGTHLANNIDISNILWQNIPSDERSDPDSQLDENTKTALHSVVNKIYSFRSLEFKSGLALFLCAPPYFGFLDIEEY